MPHNIFSDYTKPLRSWFSIHVMFSKLLQKSLNIFTANHQHRIVMTPFSSLPWINVIPHKFRIPQWIFHVTFVIKFVWFNLYAENTLYYAWFLQLTSASKIRLLRYNKNTRLYDLVFSNVKIVYYNLLPNFTYNRQVV